MLCVLRTNSRTARVAPTPGRRRDSRGELFPRQSRGTSVFAFMQISHSEANLAEIHSPVSSHYLSLSYIKEHNPALFGLLQPPQQHFGDDCPCVMKEALSGATADYTASCSDQSLCINIF